MPSPCAMVARRLHRSAEQPGEGFRLGSHSCGNSGGHHWATGNMVAAELAAPVHVLAPGKGTARETRRSRGGQRLEKRKRPKVEGVPHGA